MNDGLWFLEQTMKFAQFQREIENTELLRKSNEIKKNQLREAELQTRLLRKRKNAEREQAATIDAQRQQIAAMEQQIAAQERQQAKEAHHAPEADDRLPKCPVCKRPLEGPASSHCSRCDAEVFWIAASPCTRAFAVTYLHNDVRRELQRHVSSVSEAVEAAGEVIASDAATTTAHPEQYYIAAMREYSSLVLTLSTDRERERTRASTRLAELDGQMKDRPTGMSPKAADVAAERDEILKRLNTPNLRPVGPEQAKELLRRQTNGSIVPYLNPRDFVWRLWEPSHSRLPNKLPLGDCDYILSLFDACSYLRPFATSGRECEVFVTMAMVANVLASANQFRRQMNDIAIRLGVREEQLPGDISEGLSSLQQISQSKTFAELLAVTSRAKAAVPSVAAAASPSRSNQEAVRDSSGVEINQQRLEGLASLFIDSLCCVAVGDKTLSQAEVDQVIQVLRRLENQQEQKVLQTTIVESSKRVYAAGAALHARLVCERLIANKADASFGFILDTLRQLVGADGRSTPDELEILRIFEEQLKTQYDGAGGPRYSDLDVAQTPPNL